MASKTLLAICQMVADNQKFPRPSSIVGSTDQSARTLLALANEAGTELVDNLEGGEPWQKLRKEYTFATVSGTADYALPSDFSGLFHDTEWDRTTRWPLAGPTSPQTWQSVKSGITDNGMRPKYRIMNDRFYLSPTPTSIYTVAYEYTSTAWCQSSGGTAQAEWLADTDTCLLDYRLFSTSLIWRWRRSNGFEYDQEYQNYLKVYKNAKARDKGLQSKLVGGPDGYYPFLTYDNVPDDGYG